MEKSITIDPKIFISEPYFSCPKCQKPNCFGVLNISGNGYTRRCRECWFTLAFVLPELNKKIIYLDQFVISEMMKAVNDKLGKKHRINKFWTDLFEKIDILTKLQLAICPDSTFHRNESLLYEFKSLKRMYEQLSHGVTFYDHKTIKRFQLAAHFNNTVIAKKQDIVITAKDIIHGCINEWQDRLLISWNQGISDEEIESLRQSRLKTHTAISEAFAIWKTEKDKKFRDWYVEEGMEWGRVMVDSYISAMDKMYRIQTGQLRPTGDDLLSFVLNEATTVIQSLVMYIPNYDESYVDSIKKVIQYLNSKDILEVPFIKIGSLLWACIRHQAAHGGRKNPPNIGMGNDIEMIASFLPYCDAMFIDREMASLLNHGEVKKRIAEYGTKIFSAANKNDFMKFLDDIKDNASKEHMETIKEVYGEAWPRPFWSMYEHD